jgi:hypothetical protein
VYRASVVKSFRSSFWFFSKGVKFEAIFEVAWDKRQPRSGHAWNMLGVAFTLGLVDGGEKGRRGLRDSPPLPAPAA